LNQGGKKEETVKRTSNKWSPADTCIKITRFKAGPRSSTHIMQCVHSAFCDAAYCSIT